MEQYIARSTDLQIPIQHEGTLAIMDVSPDRVLLMAIGINSYGPLGEYIREFAEDVEIEPGTDFIGQTLKFEYCITGGIRDTEWLLRAIRRKMMRAIRLAGKSYVFDCVAQRHAMDQVTHPKDRIGSQTTDTPIKIVK